MIDSIHTFQALSANENSTQLKADETSTEPIHRKRDEEVQSYIIKHSPKI